MRVRCESNVGEGLAHEYFRAGYTERSAFGVNVGAEYAVHGMCLMRSVLCYLVNNERAQPEWIPASVFEVLDDTLPVDWRFDFFPNPGLVEAVWGFRELVAEPGYFDRLSLHEKSALAVFRKRTNRL